MLHVRYMSIQALLMLLTGKVFIPNIKKLQEVDPLESLLPSESIPDFSQTLQKAERAGPRRMVAEACSGQFERNDD
jgi:hypothetical protein